MSTVDSLPDETIPTAAPGGGIAFRQVCALACLGLAASAVALFESQGPSRASWLPLSAMLWFGGILCLMIFALGTRILLGSLWQYIFVLSSLALGCVLLVVRAEGPYGPRRCIPCVLADLAVAGIFLCSVIAPMPAWKTLPRQISTDARAALRHPLMLLPVTALLLSASGIAFGLLRHAADQPPVSSSQFASWYLAQPRTPDAAFHKQGVVELVEFIDYQCEPCRFTAEQYRPVLNAFAKDHPGSLEVRVLDFPLDSKCNPAIRGTGHTLACDAAVAVRLASTPERKEAMASWLFANQTTLSSTSLRSAARDVGGVEDFDKRYPGAAVDVRHDIDLGLSHGVNSTPTMFINGVKLGPIPPRNLAAALGLELSQTVARR